VNDGLPLIVFDRPPVGGFPHFGKIAEGIKVEHLLPIGAVEPFEICILVRLAGLYVVNGFSGRLSPDDKVAAQEFGTVVPSKEGKLLPVHFQ